MLLLPKKRPGVAPRPRILFLDAYDSFSNNITSLLTTLLDVDVFVLPIDAPSLNPESATFRYDLRRELSHYDAVVCGPGPGSPAVDKDVGLMKHIWELDGGSLLPVLGVCLGFQSLVLSCGGNIRRLHQGLHGMVREIVHCGEAGEDIEGDIFSDVDGFKATLYHSLCADVGQDDIPAAEWAQKRWAPCETHPDILPLAWVEEDRGASTERILMAVKHAQKPFWGLQYHPESVCTDEEGNEVIWNWFREAMRWNEAKNRFIDRDPRMLARNAVKPSIQRSNLVSVFDELSRNTDQTRFPSHVAPSLPICFSFRTLDLPPGVEVPDIVETLQFMDTEHVILDSANANVSMPSTAADVRGRYSIIGLDIESSVRLEYHVGDRFVTIRTGTIPKSHASKVELKADQDIWQAISEYHDSRKFRQPDLPESPFIGGFMGYITYEQGLSDIGVKLATDRGHRRPDICLVWVTKSIVVDHLKGLIHIQCLHQPHPTKVDSDWPPSIATLLKMSHLWRRPQSHAANGPQESQLLPRHRFLDANIRKPNEAKYQAKVRLCQEFIAAGESYELCLTDQTTITMRRNDPYFNEGGPEFWRILRQANRRPKSWQLYRDLRTKQPSPFASYVRLGGATLISSSPERFLQYDRAGRCRMKPMKGTVRKSDAVSTLEEAEKILHVPKEEAENLMIVDLVRHDMHGVCGPGNVSVPELMKVEEYQSVFQMITVVEGQLPRSTLNAGETRHTGLDVLAASLPPGSMTGAPKKRSCELLKQIENGEERSLYSGVVGYMCASGTGDWSVTIRSMFRWDDETNSNWSPADKSWEPQEVWHIGAGGAVTTLSTPEGESEEMFTKLAGPLGLFE